ncbi:hypothetical protein QOZ83_00050 [Romboutsia sedimentorum]|uniref:hypothetical protein n=1 Tax=Romboutsia sedimentorum TaxID=1368474 RepID=UPI0024DE0D67|nr:hypothetical protein [Romboutsia sedimentorum]MDK2584235.1 hypothetical protein [Romboutsia sedimentorum]
MNELESIKKFYRNELRKCNINENLIRMDIKSFEDIKKYGEYSTNSLESLEEYSRKYKLVEDNYKNFKQEMGKFAIGLDKVDFLKIEEENQNSINNKFIKLDKRFRKIESNNMMKDDDCWY